MKIIGHRGAAGLATENTLESIKKALEIGVDAVEFDVWTTKDNVPVLSHDSSLVRLTGKNAQVFDMTYRQISRLRTKDGQKIPTAGQALKAAAGVPVILEIKDYYLSDGLLDVLNDYKNLDISITSFNREPLLQLQKMRPDLPLYAATNLNPLGTIRFAARHGLAGVTLNYKTCSLPVYLYARHKGLNLRLFTIDSPTYAKILGWLGWRVGVVTNRPDKLLANRRKA